VQQLPYSDAGLSLPIKVSAPFWAFGGGWRADRHSPFGLGRRFKEWAIHITMDGISGQV